MFDDSLVLLIEALSDFDTTHTWLSSSAYDFSYLGIF